jgi:2',3'-cyclic-nucleotide 2'-phosphodiesterase (5'-nucleotidase family)
VRPSGPLASPPARSRDCELRLLATNDLLGCVVPLPASWGEGGSAHGVAHRLEREQAAGPALWLDSGDLSAGGPDALFGVRTLDDIAALPLAAAAAGNHEFDDGPDAARALAARLPFPLLCADRDVGLPATTLLDTPAGPLGVVGVTHPDAHLLARAPAPAPDRAERIVAAARALRAAGARWVIVLLHDGVTWWAVPDRAAPLATSTGRLAAATRAWAASVDAILGGHTFGAWRGALHGVPAGHAHPYAATVLVVDLPAPPAPAEIHPPVRVPPSRPPTPSPASTAIEAAGQRVVGHLREPWTSVPGVGRYLPEWVASAMRLATGADAAFVPASQLFTQAPLDGAAAALRAGTVTELDLERLFPYTPDELTILELGDGELARLRAAHDLVSDPANAADRHWWNWARAPAGVSSGVADPRTVVVRPFFAPLVAALLGRDLVTRSAGVGGRQALREALAS